MRKFTFFKFSPSGNTTLFLSGSCADPVARAACCRQALEKDGIDAEQAAFADTSLKSVEMAAGEFCANACRAFGALLDMEAMPENRAPRLYEMRITGSSGPVVLEVSGNAPQWRIKATFSVKETKHVLAGKNKILVQLPGISHLLINDPEFPEPDLMEDAAAQLRAIHNLDGLPACGTVWWRKRGQIFEIMPWVHVPEAGTSMLESSCGSAALALAASQMATSKNAVFHIRQPSGEELEIGLDGAGRASLCGNVILCARGELWLKT